MAGLYICLPAKLHSLTGNTMVWRCEWRWAPTICVHLNIAVFQVDSFVDDHYKYREATNVTARITLPRRSPDLKSRKHGDKATEGSVSKKRWNDTLGTAPTQRERKEDSPHKLPKYTVVARGRHSINKPESHILRMIHAERGVTTAQFSVFQFPVAIFFTHLAKHVRGLSMTKPGFFFPPSKFEQRK